MTEEDALEERRRAEEDVAFVVRLKALPEMQEKEALEEEEVEREEEALEEEEEVEREEEALEEEEEVEREKEALEEERRGALVVRLKQEENA
jgi:hypothetical protein